MDGTWTNTQMLDQVLGICGHFISNHGYSTTAVMACAHRNT